MFGQYYYEDCDYDNWDCIVGLPLRWLSDYDNWIII